MSTQRWLALIGLLMAAIPSPLPAALADSSSVVAVEAFPSLEPVHPGTVFSVAVRLKIKEGWHVNGREGLPEFFIPLDLSLGRGGPFRSPGPPKYPSGERKRLGGVGEAFPVLEGTQIVVFDLELSREARPGPLKVPLSLRLQACDDKLCLAPATLKVEVLLRVGREGEPVTPVHPEVFGSLPGAGPSQDNIISRYLQGYGWFLTFLLIFLGGLALNLTPCVYPMIPLTVSYFGSQRTERPLLVLGRAAAYVVGISVTYSSLGVTAALTGKILGSTLQSPWVLGGISLLLVVLSLSMFGLYELQAPAWLLNKVAGGNSKGTLGAFVMGLVFGIVAAPCVDPFSIGLLTFVAAKADPVLGFLMFFTLSLGLGFPYLWLGFFSSNLERLPKSGMWMVWVKKVFGLVLLGMPLYFLAPLFPKGVLHYAVPGYLLICGVLLGWVFSGSGVTAGFKKFQHAFGLLLALGATGAFVAWPHPAELPFKDYSPALLEQAKKEGKAVFIDFTADWCLPCRELEIKTFSQKAIHEAFLGWVLLRADLTQYSSEPVEELKKAYGIMGVPTLVFVGPDGRERAGLRAMGFIDHEEMLRRIAATR